jgi:hypothetical protein
MEKYIVIYKNHPNGDIIVYDGKDKIIVPHDDWNKDRRNYITSEFKYIPCDKRKTLEETYEEFLKHAEILKEETDGLINLFKSGTITQTSLTLFYHFNKVIPEKITSDEGKWLEAAMTGALAWAKPYEGEIWKYDVISMYPSIMQDNHMLFPIKQGEFQILTAFGKDYSTAIYRCKIEGKSLLFRFNKRNYYTSQDVRRARELNLKITLIQDGDHNVLFWDRSRCMTGAQLFRPFVKLLFDLKQKQVPQSKAILNTLWGSLVRKDIIEKVFHEDDDVEIYPGRQIIERVPYGDDEILIKFAKNDSLFVYDWARIGPFILGKGRSMISKLMEPNLDCIMRTHTDSMWSTKKLDISTGLDLGQVKYEGYCPDVKIVNNTNITGIFSSINSHKCLPTIFK